MIAPKDSPAARRFYERQIRVPQTTRDRLLAPLRTLAAPLLGHVPPLPRDALSDLLWTQVGEALTEERAADLRAVVLDDSDQDGRRRLLAFLFDRDSPAPFAVAKAQLDRANGSLRTEGGALNAVRIALPPELRATVPDVLHLHDGDDGEVLVLGAVRGRSAYLDLRRDLLPSGRVPDHFAAASRWLAAFHEATRHDDQSTAVHGDFWPHNLLLDGDACSVVDWEHFSPRASPFVDLFHFALTYGLSYPWKRYRYAGSEEAFARTFLEQNGVSVCVAAYLRDYASRRGLAPSRLSGAFREFLGSRGTMGSIAEPHPGTRALPWAQFAAMLDRAAGSVFP